MASHKLNCWEERDCGRQPAGPRAHELGPCPAATDTTCDGMNGGRNAGRLCWAVTGTLCSGTVDGTFEDKIRRCEACRFFRRVKYEEGCHFQLLKPGLGEADPHELHRLLNDIVKLIGICRDIFACVAQRPLLNRIAEHAVSITAAASAAAYVFGEGGDELVLEAHSGPLERPERVPLGAECPVAQAARTKSLYKGTEPRGGGEGGTASVAAIPVGGLDKLAGVLELIKADGPFSADDDWFLIQFALTAGLGIENATLIDDLRQLKRFDKAKSRFVAVLMHHITSPLATIACSLQALSQLGDGLSREDREELVRFSLQRINSVQTLSRRLLDLASIQSGRSLAQVRPVRPIEPLRQEVESRYARAQEHGVEMVVHECDEGLRVMADPDGLRVIFANLLDNAIKYCTRPTKRVEASMDVRRGRVRVAIRDTGIGIPPDDQRGIFEEFRRASNAPTSDVSGYGLGLAVVKELVDRYEGDIELESTVGEGTTFTISFPLAEPS
ncbi:MAG: ATP-binding protein [Candidatus Brocadiia bacterium]